MLMTPYLNFLNKIIKIERRFNPVAEWDFLIK